jgi:hypothetical protein
MDEIGVFSPEQARMLWQDYLTRKQLQPHSQANYPQRRPIDEPSPHRVFVRNDSGEECPGYGCLEVTGVDVVGGRTVLTCTKPTSTEGEFLFNSPYPIAADANGWAYRYGIVIALGNGTPPTEANVSYQPVADSWAIEEGGGFFTVFGEHNVATDAVIGRFEGGGGGNESIEFTVVSMDCSADPWVITAEVTWFSGGCTAAIPGEDSYGYVEIQNRCNIANYFTSENIIGLTGTATYRYPRTGECEPAWRLDDICGEGLCP